MLTILEQRLLKKIHAGKEAHSNKLTSLYFGYGANTNPSFFSKRLKNFKVLGPAILPDYKLSFNTPCEYMDKGFAGISFQPGEKVYGTLYEVSQEGLDLLDILEWVKFRFYERISVSVECNGRNFISQVYSPLNPKEMLYPSRGYLDLLINGAIEMQLPSEYIEFLKSHSIKDAFILDHTFNLANPAASRLFPAFLCRAHDYAREKLCNLI